MARPEKRLTEQQLDEVEKLSGLGLTNEQIASFMKISQPTLRKWAGERLEVGKAKALASVSSSLFSAIKKGNITAMIFYLKTQAGWKETERHEHTGPDGEPIQTKATVITSEPMSQEDWVKRFGAK